MALRNKVIKVVLAVAAGLVIGVGIQQESDANGYADLCYSYPNACDYAPINAPVLAQNVCFSTTQVVLKGLGPCATGSYAYYVKFGEVTNPNTGAVQAYIPLPDACDMGYCDAFDPNDPPGEEGAMCCDGSNNSCSETSGICPPDTVAVWCPEGKQAVEQNGEWVCEESN